MKILQIASLPVAQSPHSVDGGVGGGERIVGTLCRGLCERGHDAVMVYSKSVGFDEFVREQGIRGLAMRPVKPKTFPLALELARLARAEGAQILASHDSRSNRIVDMTARLLRIPHVATVHGLFGAKGCRKASRVIAVSEKVRQHVIVQEVPAERVVTIYNGIDCAHFTRTLTTAAAKTVMGIAPDDFVLGVVARFTQEKGHEWFLRALPPLMKEFAQLRVLFVGKGGLEDSLRALAQQLGFAKRVQFAGYHSDVAPWISAMDALALPSLHEGFGLVLAEAGALGVPVIGSDVGGIGEVIAPDETGFLIAPCDEVQLQNAVRALICDDELRAKMGAAARARVETKFSQERMIEQTEAIYRKLLK